MVVKKWWAILIGLWFILTGLAVLFHINIEQATFVLGVLAIAGGVLLVLDR